MTAVKEGKGKKEKGKGKKGKRKKGKKKRSFPLLYNSEQSIRVDGGHYQQGTLPSVEYFRYLAKIGMV